MNFELRQGGNQSNRYMTEMSDRCQQHGGFKDQGYRHNSGEPPQPTTRRL
ncbi:hypothetical protein [Candidatus Regiella insecticola]|nr:hypothetical protein [Candidatus Regiella insecticola]